MKFNHGRAMKNVSWNITWESARTRMSLTVLLARKNKDESHSFAGSLSLVGPEDGSSPIELEI